MILVAELGSPIVKIPHLCGPDEFLQSQSRRLAFAHVDDVLERLLNPSANSWETTAVALNAALSFVIGFAGDDPEPS